MTDTTKPKNGKLNLSDLTPEEIAKRMLETPPPSEKQEAKENARARRGKEQSA